MFVEQIFYTSWVKVGFQCLVSPSIPDEIQQGFIKQIVYQYWNAYNPPQAGYRGAYLHQFSRYQTVFGWLYNDESDDLGRDHIPYFIGYFLGGQLNQSQLDILWTCLETGPIMVIERQTPPFSLETIIIPDRCDYQSPRLGVSIPVKIRQQSQIAWKQGQLIKQFIAEETKFFNDQDKTKDTEQKLTPFSSGWQFNQREFMDTNTIEEILQNLMAKPIGIEGLALVSQEGKPIIVPINLDESSILIISGTMLYLAQNTQDEFNWQEIEMISVRSKEGYIILTYCHQEAFLLIKAGKVVTGLLEGEIHRTVKKLQKALHSPELPALQPEIMPQLSLENWSQNSEKIEQFPEKNSLELDTENEVRYRGRRTNL